MRAIQFSPYTAWGWGQGFENRYTTALGRYALPNTTVEVEIQLGAGAVLARIA